MKRAKRQPRFQVRDLAKILKTKPRRIEGWVEQRLLKPAVRGRGPGRRHEFSPDNLHQAALLLELQGVFGEKSPVSIHVFRAAVKSLYHIASEEDPLKDNILAVTQRNGEVIDVAIGEGASFLVWSMGFLGELLEEGGAVTLVNLGQMMRDVRSGLLSM